MEEDNLKDIFKGYEPELSSSMAFMERLVRNLEAVELIHQENEAVMKRNRIAVAIASCAGFAAGVIFSLFFSYINAFVETLTGSILTACRIPGQLYGIHIISWLLIGAASVFVALNTYTISTTLLPSRCGRRGG